MEGVLPADPGAVNLLDAESSGDGELEAQAHCGQGAAEEASPFGDPDDVLRQLRGVDSEPRRGKGSRTDRSRPGQPQRVPGKGGIRTGGKGGGGSVARTVRTAGKKPSKVDAMQGDPITAGHALQAPRGKAQRQASKKKTAHVQGSRHRTVPAQQRRSNRPSGKERAQAKRPPTKTRKSRYVDDEAGVDNGQEDDTEEGSDEYESSFVKRDTEEEEEGSGDEEEQGSSVAEERRGTGGPSEDVEPSD